jgi:hypothetical protein
MTGAPIYIRARETGHLLDPACVLRVVEHALREHSAKRLVNCSKGGFTLDDENASGTWAPSAATTRRAVSPV